MTIKDDFGEGGWGDGNEQTDVHTQRRLYKIHVTFSGGEGDENKRIFFISENFRPMLSPGQDIPVQ